LTLTTLFYCYYVTNSLPTFSKALAHNADRRLHPIIILPHGNLVGRPSDSLAVRRSQAAGVVNTTPAAGRNAGVARAVFSNTLDKLYTKHTVDGSEML